MRMSPICSLRTHYDTIMYLTDIDLFIKAYLDSDCYKIKTKLSLVGRKSSIKKDEKELENN